MTSKFLLNNCSSLSLQLPVETGRLTVPVIPQRNMSPILALIIYVKQNTYNIFYTNYYQSQIAVQCYKGAMQCFGFVLYFEKLEILIKHAFLKCVVLSLLI